MRKLLLVLLSASVLLTGCTQNTTTTASSTAVTTAQATTVSTDSTNAIGETTVSAETTNPVGETTVSEGTTNAIGETTVSEGATNAIGETTVSEGTTNAIGETTVQAEITNNSTETTQITDANQALERLLAGNQHYIAGTANDAQLTQDIRTNTTTNGQHPYATIIACSDSREPVEHIFSAGIGELFVIRTAGNVLDDMVLGSVEYGAEHTGTPLVLVMGHRNCGAVEATLKGEATGNIERITAKVQANIGSETDTKLCEELNVRSTVNEILADEDIAKLVAENKVVIKGAIYDITTGEVQILE